MYPLALPRLNRWSLVCIQTSLCHFSSNLTPNMKVSSQILRPRICVHLANQTGGILHSPPTPTQVSAHRVHSVMTIFPKTTIFFLPGNHVRIPSFLYMTILDTYPETATQVETKFIQAILAKTWKTILKKQTDTQQEEEIDAEMFVFIYHFCLDLFF